MYENRLAGLYIRLSESDGDKRYEDDSESVANQRVILTDYVNKYNLTLVDEYVDDGYSGTNFNRPSFKRMIEDITKGRINTVIVKDLSRFGRDHIDTGYFIENYFPENRIRFISVMERLDSANLDNYTDSITFVMACNDFISKQTSLKIITALNNKKKAGKYVGSKPCYGYMRDPEDKGHLIPEPVTAYFVRKIFELAKQGKYYSEIADYLNKNGAKTPSQIRANKGKILDVWTESSVRKIIENRMYTGDMIQNKSRKVSYKSDKKVRNDKKDWIIVDVTHEPLVDKETFNLLQHSRQRTDKTPSGRKKELLESIVYCKECCNCICFTFNRNKVYGDCTTHSRYSGKGNRTCKSHYIIYNDFEKLILDKLKNEKVISNNVALNRLGIQKIIDRIFIDENKLITIVLKNHDPNILTVQYHNKRGKKKK